MSAFSHKLVAVMNKTVDPGKVMNALAHMCIGLGGSLGAEPLNLIDYTDADGNSYPNISKMPFIILRANSNKIRALLKNAADEGIKLAVFTDTMTEGTWEDQIKRTLEVNEESLTFYGVVLFGPWEKVTELTKKFSLWK